MAKHTRAILVITLVLSVGASNASATGITGSADANRAAEKQVREMDREFERIEKPDVFKDVSARIDKIEKGGRLD